jgi:serine/threonine protein kinase
MMEKHVMTALDVLSDDRNLYLVMPFCGNGELFDTLHRRTKFPEDEARFWFKQLLKGLETLQRAGVCHRDISLENTITTEDHVGLVIDYGMSFKIPYVVDENGRRQRCLVNRDRPCGKVTTEIAQLHHHNYLFFCENTNNAGLSKLLNNSHIIYRRR